MCLAIPMQVISHDSLTARCEARGRVRDVTLLLVADTILLSPGDWLLVSSGNAVRKIPESEALATWALLDEMADIEARADA